MSDHQERVPNALAHGPVKSSDIERVRRDVGKCAADVARDDKASATDRVRRLDDQNDAAATARSSAAAATPPRIDTARHAAPGESTSSKSRTGRPIDPAV